MDNRANARSAAELLVNRGLRNFWYPVAPGWMVQRAPVGLMRLGERLALWRDAAGVPHALEDRCPHRGARLSLGWNLGDRIACWYHGVETGADGTVVRVPAQQSCPLEGRRIRAYPVTERNGAIFAWFGDARHEEPPALTLPDELAAPEWSSILCTAHWRCNYRYAVENVMDPMHGAYLHAASHSMAHGDKSAVMRIVPTKGGFSFEKVGQRDINFDWVEWGESGGALWMRLAIPYRKDAGPGGNFTIIGLVTPVDERNCRVFFWRCRKVEGWERDAWRFLYRMRLEGLHWDVLEQDRAVLESLAEDAREHEFLYQHDTGLSRVRRRLHELAEAQLAALGREDVAAQ